MSLTESETPKYAALNCKIQASNDGKPSQFLGDAV